MVFASVLTTFDLYAASGTDALHFSEKEFEMKKITIAATVAALLTGCQGDSEGPAVSALKTRLSDPGSLQIEHLREFEMCGVGYVEIKYTADGDPRSDRVWWNGSDIYDSLQHQVAAMNAMHGSDPDNQNICDELNAIESAG